MIIVICSAWVLYLGDGNTNSLEALNDNDAAREADQGRYENRGAFAVLFLPDI